MGYFKSYEWKMGKEEYYISLDIREIPPKMLMEVGVKFYLYDGPMTRGQRRLLAGFLQMPTREFTSKMVKEYKGRLPGRGRESVIVFDSRKDVERAIEYLESIVVMKCI